MKLFNFIALALLFVCTAQAVAPTLDSLQLNGTNTFKGQDLLLTINHTDDDGDSVTEWVDIYHNFTSGNVYHLNSSFFITNSTQNTTWFYANTNYSSRVNITFKVTIGDGTTNATIQNVSRYVSNTAPTLTVASVNGTSTTGSQDMALSIQATDPEGNDIGYWVSVFVNDSFNKSFYLPVNKTWESNASLTLGETANIKDISYSPRPFITDFDGNGLPDMICGVYDGSFYGFSFNGTGWESNASLTLGETANIKDIGDNSAPAILDFDGNGLVDMISGAQDGKFYGFSYNGSGWESNASLTLGETANIKDIGQIASPSLRDVDGNGLVDMITAGNGKFYGFSYNGSGWEQNVSLVAGNTSNIIDVGDYASPSLFDVDGNGLLDLISGADNGQFYCFSYNGTGWEQNFTLCHGDSDNIADIGLVSEPFIIDFDGNGLPDMIAGANDKKFYGFSYAFQNNTLSYLSGNYSANENVTFVVTVGDGTTNATTQNVSRYVSNTAPIIDSVQINGSETYAIQDILLSINHSDLEWDSVTEWVSVYHNFTAGNGVSLNATYSFANYTQNTTWSYLSGNLTTNFNYTFQVIIGDGVDNSTTYNVSRYITDNTPPNFVDLVFNLTSDHAFRELVQVSFNATDSESGQHSCILEFNGTNQSTNGFGSCWWLVESTSVKASSTMNLTVYANDSAGNFNSTVINLTNLAWAQDSRIQGYVNKTVGTAYTNNTVNISMSKAVNFTLNYRRTGWSCNNTFFVGDLTSGWVDFTCSKANVLTNATVASVTHDVIEQSYLQNTSDYVYLTGNLSLNNSDTLVNYTNVYVNWTDGDSYCDFTNQECDFIVSINNLNSSVNPKYRANFTWETTPLGAIAIAGSYPDNTRYNLSTGYTRNVQDLHIQFNSTGLFAQKQPYFCNITADACSTSDSAQATGEWKTVTLTDPSSATYVSSLDLEKQASNLVYIISHIAQSPGGGGGGSPPTTQISPALNQTITTIDLEQKEVFISQISTQLFGKNLNEIVTMASDSLSTDTGIINIKFGHVIVLLLLLVAYYQFTSGNNAVSTTLIILSIISVILMFGLVPEIQTTVSNTPSSWWLDSITKPLIGITTGEIYSIANSLLSVSFNSIKLGFWLGIGITMMSILNWPKSTWDVIYRGFAVLTIIALTL